MIVFQKGGLRTSLDWENAPAHFVLPRRFADAPPVPAAEFSVPKGLGPFATPERKRTISPDDLELFRLLCGLSGLTPGKMFRRMVRDEARRQIGTVAKNRAVQNTAQAEAERLFANTGRRTPVYAAPKGQS